MGARMDIKGFVEKAKDAAAAAGRAVAAPEQTSVAPAATEPDKGVAALTAFSELKRLGSEKVQELISSFQQALPAIQMAGYELTEFEIELGITPKLIPHFRHADKSLEDIEGAREALRENKLGTLILGGLLKAGEVHRQIKVAGFCFTHIEIELGLIPSIRLQYKNDGLVAT